MLAAALQPTPHALLTISDLLSWLALLLNLEVTAALIHAAVCRGYIMGHFVGNASAINNVYFSGISRVGGCTPTSTGCAACPCNLTLPVILYQHQ
jgi:hypothetical protein